MPREGPGSVKSTKFRNFALLAEGPAVKSMVPGGVGGAFLVVGLSVLELWQIRLAVAPVDRSEFHFPMSSKFTLVTSVTFGKAMESILLDMF